MNKILLIARILQTFAPAYRKLCVIGILGLFTCATALGQSASITAPFPLNEADLDFQSIVIDLTDESWADGSLDRGNFRLINAPDGLTVNAVVLISTTQAVIDLAFNGTDFDTDISNFYLTIDDSELSQTSSGVLSTNSLTINAYDERVSISPDAPLEEQTLDERSLNISLTDEEFTSTGSLSNGFFKLNNEPRGLAIESVSASDGTHAVMQLAFPPGNDFDTPISNFNIDVSGEILRNTHPDEDLRSNNLTIAARDETPRAMLSADATVLEERWLDVRTLTVNLVEESFKDYTRLQARDFELIDEPRGLKIESIIGISEVSVDILLEFSQRDFDADYPDFRVRISRDKLTQSDHDLESSKLTVVANIESATLEPDQPLREDILNGRVLTLTLVNEEFVSPGSLLIRDFELINEPSGLFISGVSAISATQAELTLWFLEIDFDSDINDFAVRINKDVLRYTSEDDLITDPIAIQAIGDGPVASLSADSVLTEQRLDARVLTIDLIQEEFEGPGILEASHFGLVNGPAGLTIESVSRISSVSAEILLQFDDTDFDDNITDFHVLIDHAGLVLSTQNLASNSLSIIASREPTITSISIPNDTMIIGDHVAVTIRVESDRGNLFTLHGGSIGGYPLSGLSRVNETTYLSGFTVTEGGNEYAAYENIPVTGVLLYNGAIPGELYNQSIIQGNDLLDGGRPDILLVTVDTTGPMDIGSEILFRINADQAGYTFTPTSHINNVPFSRSSIQVIPLGSGDYDVSYTVEAGDNDVSEGNLELEIIARDIAGNLSLPYTSLNTNDISIDASRPVIDRAYINSTDTVIRVGETLEITVEADQSGYSVHQQTRINDVPVGPNLVFTDLGNGLYRFQYTVSEDDGTVSRGNLAINIVLQDQYPSENTSLPFTALDPNNIVILTSRPSANVSGSAELCHGESAMVTVTLGGMAPWEFDIFDGTATLTVRDIWNPVYQFQTHPEITTNYTVPRVIDGTGDIRAGFGNALITVHPLPDVEIFNLLEIYDLEEPPVELDYTPAGGTFTGPGITSPPWTFIPLLAGTEDSPHEIIYTYTDQNSCSNADTVMVQVLEAGGYISFEKPVACFNDSEFIITGHNEGNTIGTFSVSPSPPEGAFSNLDSNRAVLRPALYNLSENRIVQVNYTFRDTLGEEFTLQRNLTIEKLESIRIDPIPDIYFCQNDAPIVLTGSPATGVFYGTGVTWNTLLGYQFDPSHASLDTNIIRYVYTSEYHCSVSDMAHLIVYDAPLADFTTVERCIPDDGGLIQFVNRFDPGSDQDVLWAWDFGDIFSGEDNFSELKDPSHYYDKPGSWTIRLDANFDNGCSDFIQKSLAIHPKPAADFTWNSNCLTDDPTVFEGQEVVEFPDTVSSRMWKIYRGNTEIFSSELNQPSYHFQTEGTFRIFYRIRTGAGCADSTDKALSMNPTYMLSENAFLEDFEIAELYGWSSMALDPSQNSWTFGEVSPGEFPGTAPSGTRAWFTDLPEPRMVEKSWVRSPCFNFKGFYRPMISLDIKRSLSLNQDGVALQYTVDNGRTWTNVGGMNDGGLNWYNSDKILNGNGGQHTGWTADSESPEDDKWYPAAHGLDQLTGHKEVQFRILFSSMGGDTSADGFAFDNFAIRQRSRISVLEYFTNANTPECYETDTLVRKLMKEVPADVIDIQYHAAGSMADKLYNDNPIPANNRGTVYGVTGLPMAVLDGGIFQEGLGYPLTYDFSSRPPRAEDIKLRSLLEPDFKITIETEFAPYLEISANIEALKDLPLKERVLYAMVLERRITDPQYTGTNGTSRFYNVARKMLPDETGSMFNQSWTKGQVESIHLTCEEDFFPLVEDSLCLVVYLQDENTREIIQAATIPEYTSVSIFDRLEPLSGVMLYPNPAKELVNVYFEDVPREEMQFSLYDLSGKMVISDIIEPWQQLYTRYLGNLEQGLYIVEVRTRNKRQVLYRDKLFHY
jgi:hypothetical protein